MLPVLFPSKGAREAHCHILLVNILDGALLFTAKLWNVHLTRKITERNLKINNSAVVPSLSKQTELGFAIFCCLHRL